MVVRSNQLTFGVIGIVASTLLSTATYAAVPSEIIFSNETSLALATSIAGTPGHGIAANVTKPVSYVLVSLGCHFAGALNNCPITFTDKSNGAQVATVYINANTATLTQPPVFYGTYANEYMVRGWESSPLKEISITKKV